MEEKPLFADYPELLTAPEVAEMLRVSKITLIRWAKSGKLVPEVRLNERGDKRYTKRQILAFIGQSVE
ncbi:helix-turn-helix domain-containing protein [candidate division WWE3 bacterium]|uniref:Helix-turn-helix domain-containing protein n=1 Tax=candidate division WWE3 bacterium TaxID=2053526 RepID=A0A955LH91_UNCKA|nr:helix-turn-helix domain-containing protein [candidate division WWE3 bacterium]